MTGVYGRMVRVRITLRRRPLRVSVGTDERRASRAQRACAQRVEYCTRYVCSTATETNIKLAVLCCSCVGRWCFVWMTYTTNVCKQKTCGWHPRMNRVVFCTEIASVSLSLNVFFFFLSLESFRRRVADRVLLRARRRHAPLTFRRERRNIVE